jgi:hypothetical protein
MIGCSGMVSGTPGSRSSAVSVNDVPGAAVRVMVSPRAGVGLSKVPAKPCWGTTCTGITRSSPPALTVNEVAV